MVPVAPDANVPDDPDDARALRSYADALLDAVTAAVPGWVERSVAVRYQQWAGRPVPVGVVERARRAGRDAVAALEPTLGELLATDVDEQRGNPLAILRSGVRFPSAVLREAGVPPVERDAQSQAMFPDDVYDLSPAAFADLDPSVHEPGLVWGAAKAHIMMRRRARRGTEGGA
jgi:hypothetical protein